jgi:hypothetical protein
MEAGIVAYFALAPSEVFIGEAMGKTFSWTKNFLREKGPERIQI